MSDGTTIQTTQNGHQASVTIQGKESGMNPPPAPETNKQADNRPEWLDPKFKTPEDMAKSYKELEKKLGTLGANKKEGEQTPPPAPTEKKETSSLQIEATKAVEKAGLNMKDLEAEVIAKGDLSEESLKKLEETGITKDQIAVYRRGLEAQRQDYEAKILEGVEGGREEFDQALDWARENLSEAEQASFNRVMESGDPHAGSLAVQGLMAKFQKADGPRLIDGQRVGNDAGDVFKSHAQIMAAQSDPRYESDPAFRDAVVKKIMRTDYSKLIDN